MRAARVPAGPFRFKAGLSVLVLRPDRLGDFILSTPAIQALERQLGPSARLTLVAGERNAAIARFFFPRADVLVFRRFFFSRLFLFLRLWLGHFDLTLDFHSFPFSTTSALMTLLSGSPFRVGFWDKGEFLEFSKKAFNLGLAPPSVHLHEMEKGFLLLKPTGSLTKKQGKTFLRIPAVPRNVEHRVESFYNGVGVTPKTFLLAIHPTLQKQDNRWSLEKYIELVQKTASFPRLKVLVVYGRGEEKDLQRFKEFAAEIQNLFVLPDNDILFILEAAKRFDLFVCNDSGLMHLAALVTKVLAVFGPSDPRQWGPFQAENYKPQILRTPDHRCDSVQPLDVAREIKKRIRF